MSVLPESTQVEAIQSRLDDSLPSRDVCNACSDCSSVSQHKDTTPVASRCPMPRELGVVDKLNILLPHVVSLVKILVFACVVWRALTMIQPMLHFLVNMSAFISGVFESLSRFGTTAISGYTSAMHGVSRLLGVGVGNMSDSSLIHPPTNATNSSVESTPVPGADLVYTLMSQAANRTQNFFDVFYELCNARGLESFLQETLQISSSARNLGRDAQISDRRVVVSSVMAVYTSFSNVYKVLLHVRYTGLGLLQGYIGWLLYLQERIDELPAEADDAYLMEWLSFVVSVNEDFLSMADDAMTFQAYVQAQIPLVEGAKELASIVTTDLDSRLEPFRNYRGLFNYLPDYVYDICRNNFFLLRVRYENFVLLRGAIVQIDRADNHLKLLDARLRELITGARQFQVILNESKKRADNIRDPMVIREQFVRVVDDLARKKDALVAELGSSRRFHPDITAESSD